MTGFSARTSSLAGLAALSILASPAMAHDSAEHNCSALGQWINPKTGDIQAHDRMIDLAAGRSIVMLGENHPNVEHHRWQLAAISALHGQRPEMVLGFEAFPRAVQPVLDRWVAGELSEDEFLSEANWSRNWGFDPELYLPMFHFARLHRVPMVALNIERDFVSRIGDEGLENIPEDERRGLSEPATPSDAYVESLAEVFSQHLQPDNPAEEEAEQGLDEAADDEIAESLEETGEAMAEKPAPSDIRKAPRFQRFVKVQTTWDRAMAQALAEASNRVEKPLAVGILGSGHLERGFGVPFQLNDLGADDYAVFLPAAPTESCEDYREEVADGLFILPQQIETASPPDGPRLGVMIETEDDKVRVMQVVDDSVAKAADIRDGDAIVEAAGLAVKDTAELIAVVQRQAPGTWLPLAIEREGETLEVVAKFPPKPSDHP